MRYFDDVDRILLSRQSEKLGDDLDHTILYLVKKRNNVIYRALRENAYYVK